MNKEELKKEIDRLTYSMLTLYDRDRLKEMVDQLEPEGAAHRWDLSSNHPEMKRCVVCGEKDVCIEAGDQITRGYYRGVCCGDHDGNTTDWFTTRQEAIDAWNANLSSIEMLAHHDNRKVKSEGKK